MTDTTDEMTPVEAEAAKAAFETAVLGEMQYLVGQAGRVIAELHGHFEDAREARDVWKAAQVIAAVKRAGDDLATTYGTERRELRPLVKGGKFAGPGVLIEKDYGKDRSEWQHVALLREVLPTLLHTAMDQAGVRPVLPHQDAETIARTLIPLLLEVMTPAWKVGTWIKPGKLDEATGEIVGREPATGLRQYVDPADWCVERSTNTVSVRLV